MSTRPYARYRGCSIEVHVTPAKSRGMGGISRRYRVSWTVSSPDIPHRHLASFPEQFDFLTEQEAFKYGEARAHTFIDSIMLTPSKKRRAGDSSEQTDEAPVV
ncbi:hypothetical protein J8I87_01330 [Paraburkholderia sp. LEh10]|uniref:hypothetical protein n=1 Tax=Paraburkholderia sp. LEh10 TaxID=2821353 RepID=UPI001AE77B4E|nr:hypothetical protein [Paraburkholderia sp. LEh10]MBP0588377.1 hypothetical protein [Paraburkholderia sp. LEh10]